MSEYVDGAVVRHYTTSAVAAAIDEGGGYILPGASSRVVSVTTDEYADGASAQAGLALARTPDGYYEIPVSRIDGLSEPSVVEPAFGQPGGGTEMTTGSPINVGGIPFRTFGGGS